MKKGLDIAVTVPGLFVVHHNLPGQIVQEHSHPEHHLIIPLQGDVSVSLSNSVLSCGPGRMIYVAANKLHVFKSSKEKGERLICMLDQKIWKKTTDQNFESQLLPSSQLCKELLYFILLNPKSTHHSSFVGAFSAALLEVLSAPNSHINASAIHREGAEYRPETRKAIQYVHENFQDVISMDELAKKSGTSVRNLTRILTSDLGISPKQMIVGIRLEKAKEHLKTGRMTVTETAFSVGYNSLSQFISAFRQHVGQLPSEFIQKV